jgi:hypothetical protein
MIDGGHLIFKAYLDEANTSVREPDMTVAGFLGTARQWRAVARELRTIKRQMRFQSFHGVEFKGHRGDFAGWSMRGVWSSSIRSHASFVRTSPKP